MSDERTPDGGPGPSDSDPPALTEHRRIQRRTFLKQAGVAAGLAAGAGWVSLAPAGWPLSLKDPDGERGKPQKQVLRLPEGGFAVAPSATASVLGVAHGQGLEAMVRAAIDAIGGIGRFVERGDVVVIKPNVAFERAAPLGATSNPEIVSALVRIVREAGADEVRVADNPIESPEACFARSGVRKAALDAGARVYLPSPGDFETLNVPGAKWIENWPFFWRPFVGATKVIGVAPVKDHNLCFASMTSKNWYGLLGGRRNQFHQDIHGIITDLTRMMRPTFVILDGSRVLFRSGPTGGSLADVKEGRTVVASTDGLAADAYGWDLLLERKGSPTPAYFEQIRAAGLGNPDWRQVALKEVQIG
ncbi:DUF362 domain-containing protein [Haliangium sp.]|uniref:DUF362 domain-containing protein n=1 Tax=Haliangium sp. TaxID=2663208 RepID=UPI003D0F7BE1